MIKSCVVAVFTVMAVFCATGASNAGAQEGQPMQTLMDSYLASAKKADPKFKGFSAEEGKTFFNSTRAHSTGEARGCATCHTSNPVNKGRTTVGKVIEPMAHSVNKERFTDPKKVEKWFKRNCSWVLERECTSKEKGNYITYMLSI